MHVKIIAEAGINHNGSMEVAKKLIDTAILSGCNYIKWQKRNPDLCVPESQKNQIKSTPWGDMTYLEYKKKIEFGKKEYDEIFKCCKGAIGCFASVWDKDSVDFMSNYTDTTKIPSALITDLALCKYAREKFDTLIISTGMSEESQIVECVELCDPDVIMHTNSTYPSPVDELHMGYIKYLKTRWPRAEIGYSGHEYGLVTTFAASAMGASWIERHITLDRSMWGSDQLASVEPQGLTKLVKGIRDIEKSMGEEGPRTIFKSEKLKMNSLRK